MKLDGWFFGAGIILVLAFLLYAKKMENRKITAQQLVLIAILVAIAVLSRLIFAWLPNIKPIASICMIIACAFGWQLGFLTGAMSMLVSNIFFGNGPWTPWQMLAFGLGALIFGKIFYRSYEADKPVKRDRLIDRISFALLGALIYVLVIGPILDTMGLFMSQSRINTNTLAAYYLAGLAINLVQAGMNALVLFFLGPDLIYRFEKIRFKFSR